MAREPLVSVLIPAWNAGSTLGPALRSIARQSLVDFECVIVDDGSTDATGEVARVFAGQDPRFRVLSREHGGVVAALGTGLAACRGRHVARLDADDLMHPSRLARQVAALAADLTLCLVGSHVKMFPRVTMTDGLRAYESWLNSQTSAADVRRDAFVESPLAHPTLLIRREVLVEFGYRDAGWPEDYDLLLRLLASGHGLGVVPERLVCWRDGPGTLSRTAPECSQDRIVACKAHYLATGFLSRDARYVLWGYGGTGRALGRALERHGKLPSEIVELHPGRIGQRIFGAPVIHPDALAELAGRRIVVSVAGAVARGEIRARLGAMRRVEGRDYVIAA